MQLAILALNLVYAALGVVLMYVSYRVIDRLMPDVDFPQELKRGNIAAAIFIGACGSRSRSSSGAPSDSHDARVTLAGLAGAGSFPGRGERTG